MRRIDKAMELHPGTKESFFTSGCECPSEIIKGLPREACRGRSCKQCWNEEYHEEEKKDEQGTVGESTDNEPVPTEDRPDGGAGSSSDETGIQSMDDNTGDTGTTEG